MAPRTWWTVDGGRWTKGKIAQKPRQRSGGQKKENRTKSGRIRILYAIEDLNVGGAERLLIQTASNLRRDRFEPVVCCLTRRGALADELERRGIPMLTLNKRPGVDFSVALRLASLLRRHRVDIVHTHLFTADLWGRIAGILAGVRALVTTEHSFATWKDNKRLLIDRFLDRFTRRIIAVTPSVRDYLIFRRVVPAEKITVIHNAVAPAHDVAQADRLRLRERLNLPPAAPVLGTVGRLSTEKGHELFLRAAHRIARSRPDARFLLIGGGPQQASLEAQAGQLGIADRVTFTGVRRDARELLPILDLFVLPSRTEGLSLALLEAMAEGLPIVATRAGGTPEVIDDGHSGLLVPCNDPAALADACLRLLEDGALRSSLSQQARRAVQENYSLEQMIHRTESVYENVMVN